MKKTKLKPNHSSSVHPGLDKKPGISNWVDAAGGLPSYIERIAKHIHSDSGLSTSHAIAAAVNRCEELARKGNPEAIAAMAEWNAKKAGTKGKKAVKKFALEDDYEIVDLSMVRAGPTSFSNNAASSATSGVRGSKFDEAKHTRSSQGKFGKKIDGAHLLAARRTVEAAISKLAIGQSVELPDKLGWVKRTPGGYFIQGPSGFSAAVSTLSAAVQAASIIVAGKVENNPSIPGTKRVSLK